MADLLTNRDRAVAFGEAARNTVLRHYDLDPCVQRQLSLMDLVASGSINA